MCYTILQKKAFAGYLYSISYPKAKEIDETEIVRLEMPWRTTSNRTDCGIFTIRHMETYMGEDEKAWRCGFGLEVEKVQKAQIEDLRKKYAAKILLNDVNELREFVIEDMQKYHQLPANQKKNLQRNAHKRINKRLSEIC